VRLPPRGGRQCVRWKFMLASMPWDRVRPGGGDCPLPGARAPVNACCARRLRCGAVWGHRSFLSSSSLRGDQGPRSGSYGTKIVGVPAAFRRSSGLCSPGLAYRRLRGGAALPDSAAHWEQ